MCVDEVATACKGSRRDCLVRVWIRPGGSEACLSSRRHGAQEAKPASCLSLHFCNNWWAQLALMSERIYMTSTIETQAGQVDDQYLIFFNTKG
jgi:hypothetical protein